MWRRGLLCVGSNEWSLDIFSLKNEEKQSRSEILTDLIGRAEGGLFVVCHSLRGCDLQWYSHLLRMYSKPQLINQSINQSDGETGNTDTLCVTSESDDIMTMSIVFCLVWVATEDNCVRLNESKISINLMLLVLDSLLMCMLKSPVMIKLLGVIAATVRNNWKSVRKVENSTQCFDKLGGW